MPDGQVQVTPVLLKSLAAMHSLPAIFDVKVKLLSTTRCGLSLAYTPKGVEDQ